MVTAEKVEVDTALNPGAQAKFVLSKEQFPAMMGGYRCVAAETLVSGVPVGDRVRPGGVRTLLGSVPATASFVKGRADLYRVVTRSGREAVATLGHRFLTLGGWRQLSDLSVGDYVAADGTLHDCPDSQTEPGFQDRYSSHSRLGGGLSFLEAAGVLGRSLLSRMTGVDSSALVADAPPSKVCSALQADRPAFDVKRPLCEDDDEPSLHRRRSLLRFPCTSPLLDNGTQFRPSANHILGVPQSCTGGVPGCEESWRLSTEAFPADQRLAADYPVRDRDEQLLHNRTGVETARPYYSAFWDEVVAVSFERHGDFYDLSVPGLNHYSANGLWHHNSGKTAGGVIKAWMYSMKYPGAIGVWTEPIAGMFAESLLPTLRKFYGDYEESLWKEQGKGGPNHHIALSNGCTWLLKAAETPERIVGFEAAWALMNEAASTEHGSQEESYFRLVGRLSQQGYPHWLGVATTPSGRNWLWREWVEEPKPGHVLFHAGTVENRGNLPEGYIERMTETYGFGTPMYRQYVLGEFVQMEGLVLPTFDPDTMIAPWPNDVLLRSVAGVDFGAQSPTSIVEVSITQSRRVWLREWLYQRECDDEEFVKACRDAMDSGVTLFVCDPSGKERISWMQNQGIPAVKARSNKLTDRVKAWLTPIGQNRLVIDSGSTFLIREVMGLSWAKRRGRELETDRFDVNTPDHGVDSGSYALMEVESMVLDWKPPEISEW